MSGPGPGPAGAFGAADRVAGGAVWLLVVVSPLLVLPGAIDAFTLPKLVASEILGLASVVALALARPWRLAPSSLASAPAARAVAPLLVVATAGLWLAPHPVHVDAAIGRLWVGAACLVAWSLALTPERLGRLLRATVWPGLVLAAVGVLQYHGVFQPFAFRDLEVAGRLKVASLAGNPGDLAAYLVVPCLALQVTLARGRHRALAGAGLALLVYAIGVTGSLAPLAALAIASMALWRALGTGRRAVTALGAAAVAGMLLATLWGPLRSRLAERVETTAEHGVDGLLTGRLDGWKAAVAMLEERPLTGVGLGAFRAEFAPAKLRLQEAGVDLYPDHTYPMFRHAHDEYLHLAAELGWPGVVAGAWALAALVAGLARWWRRRDGEGSAEAALAWSALLAGALLALVSFPFHRALLAYPLLVAAAVVFAAGAPRPSPRPSRSGLVVAAVAAVALALVAVGGARRIEASSVLWSVQTEARRQAAAGVAVDDVLAEGIAALRAVDGHDPANAEIPTTRGSLYLNADRLEAAEAAYREALALEPRSEIWFNLGLVSLRAGDVEEARERFDVALRLNPSLEAEVPVSARPR